jgi:hypothetical protein
MKIDHVLRSLDQASEGIEALAENVTTAIAAERTGWFGARIKLQHGRVTVVQVSSDLEIATEQPARSNRRPPPDQEQKPPVSN